MRHWRRHRPRNDQRQLYESAGRTSTLDDGSAGTLRYAIINVCPVGTITFNLPAGPQTITLTSQIPINKDVTIIGRRVRP